MTVDDTEYDDWLIQQGLNMDVDILSDDMEKNDVLICKINNKEQSGVTKEPGDVTKMEQIPEPVCKLDSGVNEVTPPPAVPV